jgi:3-hydroxybutyryl-CoA dehydrogenase
MSDALVLGAGTMGAGIAEVLAKAGYRTHLYDVSPASTARARAQVERSLAKAVEKQKLGAGEAEATLGRLSATDTLDVAAGCSVIIEAVPEDMALKKRLLGELSAKAPGALLGSNTSSLSLTELAAAAGDPTRVVGLHFFNPVPVMTLLEIVVAEQTSEATLAEAKTLATALGKDAIVVRDSPGFATSRLGIILGIEAMRMLEAGVASAADIDRAMELGYRHPMGPLKLTDLVGLDVRLSIADHLTREIGPQFTPPPLLRRLVRAGKLGKKTGEGFYRWVDGNPVPR